jgi:hypothetical protein
MEETLIRLIEENPGEKIRRATFLLHLANLSHGQVVTRIARES